MPPGANEQEIRLSDKEKAQLESSGRESQVKRQEAKALKEFNAERDRAAQNKAAAKKK